MIDRYEPVDWYKDNRPKTFRDNETGEEISLHEYRKRRKEAAAIDEGADESDDELETQAYAEPAPRPRLFDVSAARGEDGSVAPRSGVRRMGLAEILLPAATGIVQSAALFRLRHSPRQVFVPPREVTTPILAPIGRIIDRHLPADMAILMGQDGKDLVEATTALGAGVAWFMDSVQQYEGYKEYEQQQQYAERSGTRNSAPAADDSTGNWAADIFNRVRQPSSGSGDTGMGRPAANGATDVGAIRELGGTEAATRIHDLLRADAEGIMRRGLADQS